MIGFLRGIVFSFGNDYLLLEVNGVGYRITFYHPEKIKIGEELLIYTYQNVREDEISLYGFLSLEEYDLFTKLITVKGLGPKTASSILARVSVNDILKAIDSDDVAFMKKMPGIGAKTASQIILDLKGKLQTLPKTNISKYDSKFDDVIAALKSLGYKQGEIEAIIPTLAKEELDTNAYIRKALNLLLR